MKTVYIGISGDFIHHGIINAIVKAATYGDVIVGCLTDAAITEFKTLPILSFEQRARVLENIKGVSKVVAQEDWDYSFNLKAIKPDFMIHGDDWQEGSMSQIRDNCIEVLNSYGGKLIEIPYTPDVSASLLSRDLHANRASPSRRQKLLRRLIDSKKIVRVMEAHSPISALISENVVYEGVHSNRRFDGFWSSSLADSTEMGKPDIEVLDLSHRTKNIGDIFDVTTKPLIIDLDTGGIPEHFVHSVNRLDRMGVSAVIIEDKTGLKKNSLFGNDVVQNQADMNEFAEKIRLGKAAQISTDFMIIARIESLILEKGMEDARARGRTYVNAGADGIMIHSRQKSPAEVLEFAKFHKVEFPDIPLVCVPSSFNEITAEELADAGFDVVIYANHLMRASYKAMHETATGILKNDRSMEIEDKLISLKEILKLIPGTE
ncbi:phosphoenolpyruvate mutase [Planktomarina temperata]|nr:phosphoenolpyruvate mutase [Planktomarina temperata]